ncbi:hypothetical protein ACFX2K_011969 [Malus domestica]
MASAWATSSAIAAVAVSSRSQKGGSSLAATKASFFGGRKLRVRSFTATTGSSSSFTVRAAAADPDRPLWFPGSTPPPWLDGSLPGDFGFDPLGLSSDPDSLKWNQQAELVHCRWAMLGAAGIFIPEFLTKIGILNTPSWYTAGEQEYFTDTTTLFVVELVLIGWAEGRRWADIIKPGSVNTDPIFPNNKLTGTDVGYPGGLWFDPLGWGSGSPEKIKELRTKEIKNGRLAMLAVMGAWFQHIYTGTGPIDNLFAHLADPGHATIFALKIICFEAFNFYEATPNGTQIHVSWYANTIQIDAKPNRLRRRVGALYGDLNRKRPTRTRPTTAATKRTTRAGTAPAPDITIGPARAEAGDPTRSVAPGTAREGAGHGLLVHDRFDEDRARQDAETGGELSQHDRTSHLFGDASDNEGGESREREEKKRKV